MTVNLTPAAVAALEAAAAAEGLSCTDTVNRALQMWALLVNEQAAGSEIHLVRRRSWGRRYSRKVEIQ
jgi:hypothetical protein